MNNDKVFVKVYTGICQSKGFSESNMGHIQAVEVANSVIKKLTEAGLLLKAKAGTNGQEDTKNDGNAL